MSQLRPTVNLPKIAIPTGYEEMQRQAATKRKLADAMLSQGLGPRQNQTSWAQLFGQLGSVYAGKSLNKEATGLEKDMQTQLRQDYSNARGGLLADVEAGMNPGDLVAKHGGNPLLQEDIKPYQDAMATALREKEKLQNFGGRAGVRVGDVMGQYENDPNKMVHVVNGQMGLNPVAVTAQGISSGNLVPDGGYQTTAPFPGPQPMGQPQQPPMAALAPAPAFQGDIINFSDVFRFKQSLTPEDFQKVLGRSAIKINSPEEGSMLPPGTRLILPDGTEGWAQ
jgi:hypothetical protein